MFFARPFQSGRIRCRRPAAALSPRWVAGTPSGAETVLAGGRDGTENRGIRRPGRVEMEALSGRRRTGRYHPVLFCFNLVKLIFFTTERGTLFSYTGAGVLTLLPTSCDHSWGRRGGRGGKGGGRGRDLRNDDGNQRIFLRYDSLWDEYGQCPSKVVTPLLPQLKLWKQMAERCTYYCTYVRQQKKSYIELGEHELNPYPGHLPAFLGLLYILRFLLPRPSKATVYKDQNISAPPIWFAVNPILFSLILLALSLSWLTHPSHISHQKTHTCRRPQQTDGDDNKGIRIRFLRSCAGAQRACVNLLFFLAGRGGEGEQQCRPSCSRHLAPLNPSLLPRMLTLTNDHNCHTKVFKSQVWDKNAWRAYREKIKKTLPLTFVKWKKCENIKKYKEVTRWRHLFVPFAA